jgi:nuclear pore complex protein Nup62
VCIYICIMYVCMCVCVYVCMYTYVYIYICIYVFICMYMCNWVCMYLCMCMHVYVCRFVCIYLCMYVWLCMYVCMYYVHVYTMHLYTEEYNHTSLVYFLLALSCTRTLKYSKLVNHFLLWSPYTLISVTDLQRKDKCFYCSSNLRNWSLYKNSLNWQCTSATLASSSSCVLERTAVLLWTLRQ